MATITDFSKQFRGGVRANLFGVEIWHAPELMDQKLTFHCKGASIPASTIGNIDVPYRGRQLKVPGDRTYADWTATMFNDENMTLHGKFEEWMHNIQNHGANIQKTDPARVYGNGTVIQYNRKGAAIQSYSIEMYPTEVAAIDLAWDSNDAVEEYAVTFAVNWWIPKPGWNFTKSGDDAIDWHLGVNVGSEGTSATGGISINL